LQAPTQPHILHGLTHAALSETTIRYCEQFLEPTAPTSTSLPSPYPIGLAGLVVLTDYQTELGHRAVLSRRWYEGHDQWQSHQCGHPILPPRSLNGLEPF